MDENKKLLYEKIASISENKSQLIEENNQLKKKLEEYYENAFNDFCDFTKVLLEKANIEKEEVDEGMFAKNPTEKEMAKYFIRVIKDKASRENIDPKLIVKYIAQMLRVF
jgi:hypothetical protein